MATDPKHPHKPNPGQHAADPRWPLVDGSKVNADEIKYAGQKTGMTAPPIYHPPVPPDKMQEVWVSGTDPSQVTWAAGNVSQGVRDAVAGYLAVKAGGKRA